MNGKSLTHALLRHCPVYGYLSGWLVQSNLANSQVSTLGAFFFNWINPGCSDVARMRLICAGVYQQCRAIAVRTCYIAGRQCQNDSMLAKSNRTVCAC